MAGAFFGILVYWFLLNGSPRKIVRISGGRGFCAFNRTASRRSVFAFARYQGSLS